MTISQFTKLLGTKKVCGLNVNGKWIYHIIPCTVEIMSVDPPWIEFDAKWDNKTRHYAIGFDQITGVELV
jgi:hypothetical protein